MSRSVAVVSVPETGDLYEAALEKMLAYLGADMPVRHSCRPVTLREFDNGWPFVDPLLEGHTRYSSHTVDEACIPARGDPEHLAVPLDVTIVGALLDDRDRSAGMRGDLIPLHALDKTCGFAINRWRRRFSHELRGQLRIAAKHIIQCDVLTLPDGREPETSRFLWGQIGTQWTGIDLPHFRHVGNHLVWTSTTTSRGTLADDGWDSRIALAYGCAEFLDRQWSVSFKFDGNYLGLTFPTAPEHAQEVFRLRDVPPGAKRREALKHWVRAHYRRRHAEDAAATIPVIRHLRGAETFHWNGLSCRIAPAPADLRDLAQRRAARRRDRSAPSIRPRPTAAEIEAAVLAATRKEQREAARVAAERAQEGVCRWATFWEVAAFRPSWRQRLVRRMRRLLLRPAA